MSELLLADTGPLVACLARRDQYHEWAVVAADAAVAPMRTTEPVLTEAAHLLRRHQIDPTILIKWIRHGAIRVGLQLETQSERIEELMRAYSDQPMSLADASLVRLSELYPRAKLFTIDSDFKVYRRFGDQLIPLLIPG